MLRLISLRSAAALALLGLTLSAHAQDTPYKQDWQTLTGTRGDSVVTTLVDLGLRAVAPIRAAGYHATLVLPLQKPQQSGQVSPDEQDALDRVQYRSNQILTENGKGLLAGIETVGGTRTLHYYLSSARPDTGLLGTAFILYPQYKGYRLRVEADTAWSFYLNSLYPTPAEHRKLLNNKIVQQLILAGDNLGTPRPVDHFIHFKTEKDAQRFAKKARKDKYTVVSLGTDSLATPERPVLLRLSRTDNVSPVAVDAYVLPLWEAALKQDAVYEGWQTVVRR